MDYAASMITHVDEDFFDWEEYNTYIDSFHTIWERYKEAHESVLGKKIEINPELQIDYYNQ
ncbi:MAG: hypothetical protein ACRCX2_39240 [Paraclostridium sp.]